MRSILIAIAVAVAVSGCGGQPTPEMQIVAVTQPPKMPELPAACTAADPDWTPMPDAALTKADPPRNYSQNREAYTEVVGNRRVCRRAILELKKGMKNVRHN